MNDTETTNAAGEELTRERWTSLVALAIEEHPEWLAHTVNAVQRGILRAQERQLDRIGDLSSALVEALGTERRSKRRNHVRIIRGIEASNHHPTDWSRKMIEKESGL